MCKSEGDRLVPVHGHCDPETPYKVRVGKLALALSYQEEQHRVRK